MWSEMFEYLPATWQVDVLFCLLLKDLVEADAEPKPVSICSRVSFMYLVNFCRSVCVSLNLSFSFSFLQTERHHPGLYHSRAETLLISTKCNRLPSGLQNCSADVCKLSSLLWVFSSADGFSYRLIRCCLRVYISSCISVRSCFSSSIHSLVSKNMFTPCNHSNEVCWRHIVWYKVHMVWYEVHMVWYEVHKAGT